MKKIVCMLAGMWILKHRSETEMPVTKLSKYLAQTFGARYGVEKETYNILEFTLDNVDKDKLIGDIKRYLHETYADFDDNDINVEVLDSPDREPSDGAANASADDNGDDTSADDSHGGRVMLEDVFDTLRASLADGTGPSADNNGGASIGGNANTNTTNGNDDAVKKVLTDIDNLISGEQFKAFAHETALMAPKLIRDKMETVFFQQRLLLSINDGYGLGDYLKHYAALLSVTGLRKIHSSIVTEKLSRPKPNTEDPRTALLDRLSGTKDNQIVCIDISDWMNDVKSLEFREFLVDLAEAKKNGIVLFRVPFIDKEVLDKISLALNDTMFIREMSFPPFSNEEIGRYADVEVGKFGFSMDEKAWDGFFRRIRQESSDGKFYGIDTIRKVVAEILYNKQLSNAQTNADDKIIRADDTERLCNKELFDNLSGMEMLDKLVGTEQIKQRVLEIVSQIELARQNPALGQPALHMRFVGNPGTGKTTIARIIGKILKEKGVLRIGEFHEQSGRDFCGRYIGETAPKTLSLCRAAYGSVLFIDEAYSLYRGDDDTRDFGREALDTLIAEMENHRNDFVVIMAGYTDDINRMMKGNSGLESRMPYVVEFPNFTKEQLYKIFESMVTEKLEYEQAMLDDARKYFDALDDNYIASKEFSNARFVRNLYERVCAKAAMRCQLDGGKKIVLTQEDFARSINDKEFASLNQKKRGIGFGQ